MTQADSASRGRVTIERLSCTYLVSRDHPAPDVVRGDLDALAWDGIAAQCRALLPAVLDPDDPSIWFIRRLDVDVGLDVSAAPGDLLAQSWSRQIVASLADVVARGPRGDEVVRFADRAEYLASFVHELTRGRAWGPWYYDLFDGLSSLPAGRATADALAREPEFAQDVLLRLDRWGELDGMLDLLTPGDAEVIWALCVDPNSHATPQRQTLEDVLAVWPAVHLSPHPGNRAADALRLYVATLRRAPGGGYGDNVPAAVLFLLDFAGMLASIPRRSALLDAVATGDLRAAVALLHDAGHGDSLASLPHLVRAAGRDRVWITEVSRVVGPPDPVKHPTPAMQETAITAFGGIFLLLPVLLGLQLDRLFDEIGLPETKEDGGPALLRLLLAIACFGRERAIAAALDPVLARVSGLQRAPTFETLEQTADGLTPAVSETCLRFLAGALSRQGRIDGRCLAADLLTLPFGGDVLLLRDTTHDVWLYAAPAGDDCGRQLQDALELVVRWADIRPKCILANAELDHRLGGMPPAGWPEDLICLGPDSPLRTDYRESINGDRARVRPVLDDLLHVSLAGLHPLTVPAGHADLTLCLLARALLSGLATRLLGFEWSSCSFLLRNFLVGISTVCFEPGRIAVQLARPPLHVILSLTGIDGQMYDLPWLDGEIISVSLAEE